MFSVTSFIKETLLSISSVSEIKETLLSISSVSEIKETLDPKYIKCF